MKKKYSIITVLLLIVFSVHNIIAHDFWLLPEFSKIPDGWRLHIYGQTGMNYPESVSAVSFDRIKSAKLVNNNKEINIKTIKEIGSSLALEVTPPESGQWYVSVEIKQRRSDLKAEQFTGYLTEHKLFDILELRKKRNETNKAVTRVYEKSAKTLVTVGNSKIFSWDKVLGHVLEIIPIQNPESLKKGDMVSLKVLYNGKPLENALISAGYAGDSIDEGSNLEKRTNSNGIVEIPLSNAGRWYFNTINVVEETKIEDIEWHSYTATLTFEIK